MILLIQEIKLHTEAGSILEHMHLFDELEELHDDTMNLMATAIDKIDSINKTMVNGMNTIIGGEVIICPNYFRLELDKMRISNSL